MSQFLIQNDTNIHIQTVQRLADSWRNVIGSTAIVVLMAFLDSQEDLQDSDEEHQEFCKYYLNRLRFLYEDSENEDKKVCKSAYYPVIPVRVHPSNNNVIPLEMEGALPPPFHPPDFRCAPHCH